MDIQIIFQNSGLVGYGVDSDGIWRSKLANRLKVFGYSIIINLVCSIVFDYA